RPVSMAATNQAARLTLATASANGTLAGSAARARSVATVNSGTATTRSTSQDGTSRLHRSPPSVTTVSTAPPNSAGATLSGCPSSRQTRSSRSSRPNGRSSASLAATAPPTIAAALLPRPRPSGMALWQRTEKLVRCPARCATAAAARYTRLVTGLQTAGYHRARPSPALDKSVCNFLHYITRHRVQVNTITLGGASG